MGRSRGLGTGAFAAEGLDHEGTGCATGTPRQLRPREDLVSPGRENAQEQPLVAPQVAHFMQVPLRTSVKLPQSPQASPS